MTKKEILLVYNQRKSIRQTAIATGVSEKTVKKVLVTYGVIDTPLIRRIAELRRIGLNQCQIAEMLGVSDSCVNENTPYDRGSYLTPSQTKNAIAIRECRKRKEKKHTARPGGHEAERK